MIRAQNMSNDIGIRRLAEATRFVWTSLPLPRHRLGNEIVKRADVELPPAFHKFGAAQPDAIQTLEVRAMARTAVVQISGAASVRLLVGINTVPNCFVRCRLREHDSSRKQHDRDKKRRDSGFV